MKQLSFMLILAAFLFTVGCTPSGSTTKTKSKSKIKFVEGKTYEDVLAQAQREGKPIMIDFYTTWCAPCKWLENDVFSLPSVSSYYNKNLVSYKVNAEDFDNVALAQEYAVAAYPTLVFITQDGEFVRKQEGTTTATKFMEWGKEAVIKNQQVQ